MVPKSVQAQVQTLVIGEGGVSWEALGARAVGLEDAAGIPFLQPKQLDPSRNLLVGERHESRAFTNLLGHEWSLQKSGWEGFELGVNPRMWPGQWQLIDGNPGTVIRLVNVVQGSRSRGYTFDLGFPLPINRVVFFPPDRGIDEEGGLMKQRFPRAYEVSGALDPEDFLLFAPEEEFHTLDRLLERTFFNDRRVADVRFPTQFLRFVRIGLSLVPQKFLLGEIQIFGEGFIPQTTYSTVAIPLGEPVNFGRIFWAFSTLRQPAGVSQPVPAPEAPVQLTLETRTGRDDTPQVHYLINEFDKLTEVDKATYLKAPVSDEFIGPRPGDRAEVEDDLANWSAWSTPYGRSGQALGSPDGRRFLQVRIGIRSEDLWSFGRMARVGIEYSPLLVQRLIGEVGLAGAETRPGPVEVPAGVDTAFVYAVRADFGPQGRVGFDMLKLDTFAPTTFVRLEMGLPPRQVEPDSVRSGADGLTVYFPSNKVVRANGSAHVRLVFRTALLNYSAFFLGEVADMTGDNLPQSVDGGDATEALHTNDVRVFAVGPRLTLIKSFTLSTPVLTPNGDRINDAVDIGLTLLGVEDALTTLGVYDVSGRPVRRLVDEPRSRGAYRQAWDGRTDTGDLVMPGVYILRLKIGTARGVVERVRTISVAY